MDLDISSATSTNGSTVAPFLAADSYKKRCKTDCTIDVKSWEKRVVKLDGVRSIYVPSFSSTILAPALPFPPSTFLFLLFASPSATFAASPLPFAAF